MKEADPDFIEAVALIFGEHAAQAANERNVEKLREVWERALVSERKHVFDWMRADVQTARCEDKEWIVQASWVIGNGTYRTRPSLDSPLSWMEPEEIIQLDDDVRSQLLVTRKEIGYWEVRRHHPTDPPLIANILIEEDDNEREHHRVELLDGGAMIQMRMYQTWEQSIHAIITWVKTRK